MAVIGPIGWLGVTVLTLLQFNELRARVPPEVSVWIFASGLLSLWHLFAGVHLWRRRPSGIAYAKRAFCATPLLMFSFAALLASGGPQLNLTAHALASVIGAAIWCAYLDNSKRVAATYGAPVSPDGARQRRAIPAVPDLLLLGSIAIAGLSVLGVTRNAPLTSSLKTTPESAYSPPVVSSELLDGTGLTEQAAEIGEGKAIQELRLIAERGDPVAQNNLGVAYADGDGVREDDAEAVRWFQKSAEQGLAMAQLNLATAYQRGKGAARDHRAAVLWFKKASAQGLADAQYQLGLAYWHGEGVARDEAEARRWLGRAAKQGYSKASEFLTANPTLSERAETSGPDAQFALGFCYHKGGYCAIAGRPLPVNPTEAVKWWRKAAGSGHTAAQANLGWAYYAGVGVEKKIPEAIRWYRQAAEGGYPKAQATLGWFYEKGIGVEKDLGAARAWYQRAAASGETDAAAALKRVSETSESEGTLDPQVP